MGATSCHLRNAKCSSMRFSMFSFSCDKDSRRTGNGSEKKTLIKNRVPINHTSSINNKYLMPLFRFMSRHALFLSCAQIYAKL